MANGNFLDLDAARSRLLREGVIILDDARRQKAEGFDAQFALGAYHEISYIAEALGIAEFGDFEREIAETLDAETAAEKERIAEEPFGELGGNEEFEEEEESVNEEEEEKDGDNAGKPDYFQEFWDAYPKKRAKLDAQKAWNRLRPDKNLREKISRAVKAAKNTEEWRKDGGRFIPYPASWLNGGHWDDELTPGNEVNGADKNGEKDENGGVDGFKPAF